MFSTVSVIEPVTWSLLLKHNGILVAEKKPCFDKFKCQLNPIRDQKTRTESSLPYTADSVELAAYYEIPSLGSSIHPPHLFASKWKQNRTSHLHRLEIHTTDSVMKETIPILSNQDDKDV